MNKKVHNSTVFKILNNVCILLNIKRKDKILTVKYLFEIERTLIQFE